MTDKREIAHVIRHWTESFAATGLETASLDARTLVLFVAQVSREELIANPDRPLSKQDHSRIAELCRRRRAGEPVAYLTGYKEFWSLEFKVTPDVLIPRPDSETLVTLALSQLPDRKRPYRILDLGTGSGCLLIALLSELPEATGIGIDSSLPALEVARENARHHGLAARSGFQFGDWTEGLDEPFDLIVSNPPYVLEGAEDLAPEVESYEPQEALFGGKDGLDPLRRMAPDLKRLLTPKGSYVMEYGQGQALKVAEILAAHGLEVLGTARDLAGIERASAAKVAKM